MNGKLIAEAEELKKTAERLGRVGLVVDRTCFSSASRRAAFALQSIIAEDSILEAKQRREPIGFEYPNAR